MAKLSDLENADAVKDVPNTTLDITCNVEPPGEGIKYFLRERILKKLKDANVGEDPDTKGEFIPMFVGVHDAERLLYQTEEYKKAEHIRVNMDRMLNGVKMRSLLENKCLYLPSTRFSNAILLKVEYLVDGTRKQKRRALHSRGLHKYRSKIHLDSNLKLDMVIIGSLMVTYDGYRIGRSCSVDEISLSLLIELGMITPETIIVTIVHDLQLLTRSPVFSYLYQKHDIPVDMIVTPNRVIRVPKTLPRPSGVSWNFVSQTFIQDYPVLLKFKIMQMNAEKAKEENAAVESSNKAKQDVAQQERRNLRPLHSDDDDKTNQDQ